MIAILLVVALGAVLVWAGRKPSRVLESHRLVGALFSVAAAIGAVVFAVRGGWIPSLILVGLAVWLGRTAASTPLPGPAPRESGMSLEEARSILGVGVGAGQAEVQAAYRRLMQRTHPDHGGTTGLAAQLNAARDRLLGKGDR